jgi:hypothetical protein
MGLIEPHAGALGADRADRLRAALGDPVYCANRLSVADAAEGLSATTTVQVIS